ncbi:MAG: hypothetical protein HYU64_19000 [Armatimonadetes bacterium]|nr:hypothetical protein [Armatimonadota bacterium]
MSRKSGGDQLGELQVKILSFQKLSKASLRNWIILGLAVTFLAYVILIPPLGPLPRAEWPEIKQVPENRNAWREYEPAAAEMKGKDWAMGLGTPEDLSKLNAEQKAFLDRHGKAFTHVLAGSRLPYAQFYKAPLTMTTKTPDYPLVLRLTMTSLCQVRRLEIENRPKEAAQLLLSVYRMASDMAEPNTGLLPVMISLRGRQKAAFFLFRWFGEGKTDRAMVRDALTRIAEANGRMPTADEVISWEWRAVERELENTLVRGSSTEKTGQDLARIPYGFRLRIYRSFMRQYGAVQAAMQPGLRSWDFKALEETSRKTTEDVQKSSNWMKHPLPWDLVAWILTAIVVPTVDKPARTLYLDKANSSALLALGAALAYRKTHGKFPEALAPALKEAGLATPPDPCTGKPVGYRLEKGKPVVWLAGFDGKDDGGKTPYENSDFRISQGTDLVYRLGEIPPWLFPPARVKGAGH